MTNEKEVAELWAQGDQHAARQVVAPLAGADGRGFVAFFDAGARQAAVRKNNRDAEPTPSFDVPATLTLEVGDYVAFREIGSDRMVTQVLDRNALNVNVEVSDHPDLATHDAMGLATDAELAAHVAAGDPHPGYTTAAELATAVSTHEGLADPHPGYTTAAELAAYAQPLDSDLTAIALLTTTSYGRALLELANQAALQSAVGIGTAGLLASDTDGTLAANSDSKIATQKATKTYVDTAVTGLLDFKGSTNCSGNPNYPAASKGDAYVVSTAGKIGGASGKSVDISDMYVATADNAGGTEASVGTSWVVLEHNLVGALLAANNLSDVASTATARANLVAAPAAAKYIVQTADSELSAEQALSALASGIVKNTTTTGVLSIAAQGTDYYAPGGTDVAVADGGTGASTGPAAQVNLGIWDAIVVKASDESVTNNTIQNDDELFFTTVNGQMYYIELLLQHINAAGATPDLKIDLGEDSNARGVFECIGHSTADAAVSTPLLSNQTATASFGTGTSNRGILIRGTHRGGGGTFRLRWAQDVTNATATKIVAGSLLRYKAF